MPPVFLKSRLNTLASRRERIAASVYFHTGIWPSTPHPFLRTYRLAWQSTAKPGTIVAKHTH